MANLCLIYLHVILVYKWVCASMLYPFPSFTWKCIHWVLCVSFGHATWSSLGLAFMISPDLKDCITVICVCGDLICWLYIWSFPHTATAVFPKIGSYNWSGDWSLSFINMCLFEFYSVVVIALWFRPRKRKILPFHVFLGLRTSLLQGRGKGNVSYLNCSELMALVSPLQTCGNSHTHSSLLRYCQRFGFSSLQFHSSIVKRFSWSLGYAQWKDGDFLTVHRPLYTCFAKIIME